MHRLSLIAPLMFLLSLHASSGAAQAPEIGAALGTPPAEEAEHADRWMSELVDRGGGGPSWYVLGLSTALYTTTTVAFTESGLAGNDGALLAAGGNLVLWSTFLVGELLMPMPSAAEVEGRYRWLPPDRRRAFVADFLRERAAAWRTRGELMIAMQIVGGAMSLAGGLVMGEADATANGQHRAALAMTMGAGALFGSVLTGLLLALFDEPIDGFSHARFVAGEEPELP